MKFSRVAFISDAHIPVEVDWEAWNFTLDLMEYVKPTGIFLGGDNGDIHGLANFAKPPTDVGVLQNELDQHYDQVGKLIDRAPSAWVKWIPGNHEDRLRRYVMGRAPGLYGLTSLNLETILRLDELGIETVDSPHRIGKIFLLHGHEIKVSGGINPARAMALKVNDSAIMGHVHKFSISHKTSLSGKLYRCYTNGCLAVENPSYLETPDWAQGFSLIDFIPSGMFQVQQVFYWREKGILHTVIDGELHRNVKVQLVPGHTGRPKGAVDRRARRRT